MIRHFELTRRAQSDLDEIWDYSAMRWGLDQAETYVRRIWTDIAVVASTPALGRARPEIRPGYHCHPTGSHILFFRRATHGIEVVRILHYPMDPQRQDFE